MTRRRKQWLASRLCIGMFLLLFSDVTGDATGSSTTILGKVSQNVEQTLPANRTFLSKVSSKVANNRELPSLSGTVKEERVDDRGSSSHSVEDSRERVEKIHGAVYDESEGEKTNSEGERDEPTIARGSVNAQREREASRSSGESSERSTALNVASRKSRFGEIVREGTGKSSSRKLVSEDTLRLSGTNGLNSATGRPEETFGREEKKERSGILPSPDITGNNDDVEALPRLGRDRELTVSSEEAKDLNGKGKSGEALGHEPTEQKDLEERVKTEEDSTVSLANDTQVNDNHRRKILTDKSHESGVTNRTSESANKTNLIPDDSPDSRKQNPKEQVEVIANSTYRPSLRIVSGDANQNFTNIEREVEKLENDLKDRTRSPTTSAPENFELVGSKKGTEESGVGNRHNAIVDVGHNGTASGNDANQARENSGDVRSPGSPRETSTLNSDITEMEKKEDDKKPETREVFMSSASNQSLPVAKGRTIAFSDVNGFPNAEIKTITNPPPTKNVEYNYDKTSESSVSKKNPDQKSIEQKQPYPYAKSVKDTQNESVTKQNLRNPESVTEETSAFENTIGRSQSEKKFVVTEPSVVFENSIQQFKPSHYKRSGNGSRINSTVESQEPLSMTAASLIVSGEILPTNATASSRGTFREKPSVAGSSGVSRTSSTENDVPRGDVGDRKEITGKDDNFDVTGNGITEVSSSSPESTNAAEIRSSFLQPSNVTKEKSVEVKEEKNASSNMDVQTDAEDSSLMRSTLNATEDSKEYPVNRVKSNSTVITTTLSTVTDVTSSQETARSSNVTPKMNVTTLSPDESSLPTTTSIEVVFIELTDRPSESQSASTERTNSTTLHSYTTTEGLVEASTLKGLLTTLDDSLKLNTEEETTTSFPTIVGVDEFTTPENQPFSLNSTGEFQTTRSILETSLETEDSTTSLSTTPNDFTITEANTAIEEASEMTDSTTVFSTTEPYVTQSSDTEVPSSGSSITETPTATQDDFSFSTSRPSSLPSSLPPTVNLSDATETSTTTLSTTTGTILTRDTSPNISTTLAASTLRPRIVPSTWSTTSPVADLPTERTTEITQTLSPDEITLLVSIVLEGSWREVCPHLSRLRQVLAKILTTRTDKSVSEKEIMFHQSPCLEPSSAASTSDDMTSILVYVVDEDGKFDAGMTKILPSLYDMSTINFPLTIHSFRLVQETDSGNAIAVVIVSSVAFICLVLLAGLLFIMRKRQTRFNYGERCRPVSLDAYSLDSVSAYNSVRRKGAARASKRSYGNPTFEDSSAIPSHPLNFAGLSSFCNDVNAINEQFSGIPQVSGKIDELPVGAEVKNRYANVIPLPETRVPLQRLNNDPLTEYINASYVRGPKNATKYYIACQAPIESTVTDFWRMIWEQQCKVIIMLTDLVENGVEKCIEYIPPSEVTDCHRLYGDFQVTLKKRETKEKYAISTLQLKNLENNTFREVFHIWYLWPVNGVQSDGAGLIAVLLEARALQRGGPGPIVIHCSPGTGRTGTLIALDLGIRQYEITRTVDVPRVVYTIRRDRAGAVQTKEQYAFIYKALNLYATKLAGGVLEST